MWNYRRVVVVVVAGYVQYIINSQLRAVWWRLRVVCNLVESKGIEGSVGLRNDRG